ncbi:MAG: anthranilate phosphoribosyltransferase [Candidatus Marinimicrobia bacterium]|nr:anthranilate phosphoribosyltransferase [Candidatus Neomarinimicrobiota bacterium]
MKQVLEKLLDKESLTRDESYNVMGQIMSGGFDDVQVGAFLVALRAKGETVDEVVGFADAMRKKMTPIQIGDGAIDMCGTGGDMKITFNISTAASFLVAGAGVKVAKHGNRAASSRSGSADVLTALGVDISMSPEKVALCVEEIGIGFLFAPALHPAIKYAVPARKSLAIRTVFNILGPLCNPAKVKRQVLGVFAPELTSKMANILKALGSEEVMVIYGNDGLDELTITTTSSVSHLTNDGNISEMTINPQDYGFPLGSIEDLRGGSPDENAQIIEKILKGEKGPRRDVVVLNAAAGIMVGGKSTTMEEGIQLAKEAIDSGKALNVLQQLAAA